ncbi:MAG: nitroreductase [Verrucomicrobia bacterium]|jgi:nitroreductase|nr:nitroreductase [Verrucomicrobiota bacterium]
MNVSTAIAERFSCRSYKTDAIPGEMIHTILEAGRLAPSACNQQPWRFAVVTSDDARTKIVETAFLKGIPMKWALNAPVFFVLGMVRSTTTHKVAPLLSGIDYPWVDIGIAGEHMALQATELGLGTCWIGWIHKKRLRNIVGWPRNIRPAAILTCGCPAENTDHPRRGRLELNALTSYIK